VELVDAQRRVHARGGQKKVDFYLRPAEPIEAHRAFIAAARPSEVYRTPTEEEWDAFLAYFEKSSTVTIPSAQASSPPAEEGVPEGGVIRPVRQGNQWWVRPRCGSAACWSASEARADSTARRA
jgi:hypothetical protein